MIEIKEPKSVYDFKGYRDDIPPLLLNDNDSENNQNCLTDEINGIITRQKGFVKIGNIGSMLLIDDCNDASVVWTGTANSPVSRETGTAPYNFIEGTSSVKIAVALAFTTGVAAYHDISSIDLSGYTKIGFYIKSSVNTNITNQRLQFLIDEDAGCVSPSETLLIPALTGNVWQYVVLTFAGAVSTRDAIVSIGINVADDFGVVDIYIDNIEVIRSDFLPIDLCETNWTASTNVTSATEGTIIKQGTYSIKISPAAAFTTGLLAYRNITSINLAKYKRVGFWIRSSINLSVGDLSILLDNTNGCVSPLETIAVNTALTADTWKYITVKLSTPASDTTIISVGLQSNRDFGACDIYIDDIRALKPVQNLYEYIESDGTNNIIADDGNTIWQSVDGSTWNVIASGYNAAYPISYATFEGDLYFVNGDTLNMRYTSAGLTQVFHYISGDANTYCMPKARVIWVHPGGSTGAAAAGAILFLGYTDSPSTLRWSDPAVSPISGSAGWFPAARSKDLEADLGDRVTGAIDYEGKSVIFVTENFFILSGIDSSDFDFASRGLGIGCTFKQSIQKKDGYLMFADNNGYYMMNMSFMPERISDRTKTLYSKFQQALVNYYYWLQTLQSDWVAGTTGTNQLDTSSSPGIIKQLPQTTQADFDAGTKTNVSTTENPNNVVLGRQADGNLIVNLNTSLGYVLDTTTARLAQSFVYAPNYWLTSLELYVKRVGTADAGARFWVEIRGDAGGIPNSTLFGQFSVLINNLAIDWQWLNVSFGANLNFNSNQVYWIYTYVTGTSVAQILLGYSSNAISGNLALSGDSGSTWTQYYNNDISVKINGYHYYASGNIISQTLDFGVTPSSLGNLAAEITTPSNTGITFQTRTSPDNVDWTAAWINIGTAGENNGVINSTAQRYLQWKTLLTTSDERYTPTLSAVYVGGTYLTQQYQVTNISAWSSIDILDNKKNQTINYYYKTASTQGGLSSASWTSFVSGNSVSAPITNVWIQGKAEFSTNNYTQLPELDSITFNWINWSGSTLPTTSVASVVYDKRYYLFATKQGYEYNSTGICIDRLWNQQVLQDYPVGSMCLYKTKPYFGSSIDGKIYQFLSGYKADYSDWSDALGYIWDTKRYGIEHKEHDKWYQEIVVFYNPKPSGTLTIYYDINNTGVWTSFGNIDLTNISGEKRFLFTDYIKGRDIKFRFYNNTVDIQPEIIMLKLFYQVWERIY